MRIAQSGHVSTQTCYFPTVEKQCRNLPVRTLVKSAYRKTNFLISLPKHMLWVLKRAVSMRQFF